MQRCGVVGASDGDGSPLVQQQPDCVHVPAGWEAWLFRCGGREYVRGWGQSLEGLEGFAEAEDVQQWQAHPLPQTRVECVGRLEDGLSSLPPTVTRECGTAES